MVPPDLGGQQRDDGGSKLEQGRWLPQEWWLGTEDKESGPQPPSGLGVPLCKPSASRALCPTFAVG